LGSASPPCQDIFNADKKILPPRAFGREGQDSLKVLGSMVA
jgi:hypothetical protein